MERIFFMIVMINYDLISPMEYGSASRLNRDGLRTLSERKS